MILGDFIKDENGNNHKMSGILPFRSKKRAFDLVEQAKKAIEPWGADAKYLISLADFITNRDR